MSKKHLQHLFLARDIVLLAGMLLTLPSYAAAQQDPADRPPNVIFILADDLGWSDTSIYGSNYYETPNIDRLAQHGMRFMNAYMAPFCSPSRAGIMTGQWPARLGFTRPSGHAKKVVLEASLEERGPQYRALTLDNVTRLDTTYHTLAEAFQDAGYVTAHMGKWHLGRKPYGPLKQGFNVTIPNPFSPRPGPGGGGYKRPGGYMYPWPVWPGHGQPGDNLTDRMAEEASKFIRQNKNRPFFLNYWMWAVHKPFQPKPGHVDKWEAKADPYGRQKNAFYAALVETMDQAVGRVMQTIRKEGLLKNTIVIFTSDNGGLAQPAHGLPPKYTGMPVTSNVPLRGGKGTLYEGGTRVPLIVSWPGQIKGGVVNRTDLVQSIDFYPTLVELCDLQAEQARSFDGVSIAPTLRGGTLDREAIFGYFPHYQPHLAVPSVYVRKGPWKLLLKFYDKPDQTHRFELYNLKKDIGETVNVASEHPKVVKELKLLIDRFLEESDAVVSKPNPAYVPPGCECAGGG